MFRQVAAKFKQKHSSREHRIIEQRNLKCFESFVHLLCDFVMETPICLSQYFVNKQNVRSCENIIKRNILKAETNEFLKHLFEGEEYLVSYLPDQLVSLITDVKTNMRAKLAKNFKEYFKIDEERNKLHAVNKEEIFENCCKAMNDIVPKKIFGGNHNSKVFRNLIQSVIYSMRRQHIILRIFIEKWDFTVSPWNGIISLKESKKILYYLLRWILKYILSVMICLNFYVTTCKTDADENKLHYFLKPHWQSFYDKKIFDMVFTKVIKKCEMLSTGNKVKRKHSVQDRLKLKLMKKDIPKLHLVLKSNNDCRPIVRYRNDSQNPTEKYKMKERLKFLKILTGKPHEKIESLFTNLHKQWLRSNKPKLYFVKTDLSNAFGSVLKEKLLKILCEKHMAFQKTEKNVQLKKKMAQHYKDTVTELRRPLLVRVGSTVFEWTEGLVQGYKYSPALSELYYAYMDQLYFSEHLEKSETQIKLFTRVVDDYLYITDSLDDAHLFLDALSNYRNVNYAKSVVNFEPSDIRIKFSEDITFLGYSYNTETMEVSRASNVFVGQMCFKIAFTMAISDVSKFIENRIGQSGIQISGPIFNLLHNPEELIWKHIFTTFCLSANKFCTILAVLCNEKEMIEHMNLYKKRVVVKLSNAMIDTLLRNKHVNIVFIYCINHFRHLSWKALYLCAKRTPKCSGLIPHVNNELAKTNCLFGKWREHASAISTNGETIQKASMEICRRSDLRAIVRQFDCLPEGFECYNQRKIENKTK